MGFFGRAEKKPEFINFSADHFKTNVQRILWDSEILIADGFFEDGPDPLGEEDPMKGFFGGNSHTYLAVTTWRIILGYLANGEFSSHEYSESEPQVRRNSSKFYFTYSNPMLKVSGSPTYRSTYSVSKEVSESIENNMGGVRPSIREATQIYLSRKSWGNGPIAELAKSLSGQDYMLIEICKSCNGNLIVPDDIESSPEKGNTGCYVCLRAKA
jgi:hypothetical protein